jgi:hypothetical protein
MLFLILRGAVNDWYEILFNYAKFSFKARQYMIKYLFIENSVFIAQYFLDCPSNEVSNILFFFYKTKVIFIHFLKKRYEMH